MTRSLNGTYIIEEIVFTKDSLTSCKLKRATGFVDEGSRDISLDRDVLENF